MNAHASATPLNDKTETMALKAVFGEHAPHIPITATKAMHGHALGASGAFEAAIAALTLVNDFLPATINLRNPDPECDLDYTSSGGRDQRVHTILSNSFGFGGINASLVFGRGD